MLYLHLERRVLMNQSSISLYHLSKDERYFGHEMNINDLTKSTDSVYHFFKRNLPEEIWLCSMAVVLETYLIQ